MLCNVEMPEICMSYRDVFSKRYLLSPDSIKSRSKYAQLFVVIIQLDKSKYRNTFGHFILCNLILIIRKDK